MSEVKVLEYVWVVAPASVVQPRIAHILQSGSSGALCGFPLMDPVAGFPKSTMQCWSCTMKALYHGLDPYKLPVFGVTEKAIPDPAPQVPEEKPTGPTPWEPFSGDCYIRWPSGRKGEGTPEFRKKAAAVEPKDPTPAEKWEDAPVAGECVLCTARRGWHCGDCPINFEKEGRRGCTCADVAEGWEMCWPSGTTGEGTPKFRRKVLPENALERAARLVMYQLALVRVLSGRSDKDLLRVQGTIQDCEKLLRDALES